MAKFKCQTRHGAKLIGTLFSKISLIGTNTELAKFKSQTRHGAKPMYIISELLQQRVQLPPNDSHKNKSTSLSLSTRCGKQEKWQMVTKCKFDWSGAQHSNSTPLYLISK
jgi:hypothetical protein